ncbi:MAG: GxxExxY protein, partial [Bacteroidota bacterium]
MADIIKDTLTEKIIGCCYRVHTELGPGFRERNYHNALEIALKENDLMYESEKVFEV